jgi:hypothetical protein
VKKHQFLHELNTPINLRFGCQQSPGRKQQCIREGGISNEENRMNRPKLPFRADHVGSLLRPQALHEARAKRAEQWAKLRRVIEVADEVWG